MKNLTVRFGGPPLLDSAGFTLQERERVCLMGRNGCGKTTLLRIVSGLIQPDQADVVKPPRLRVASLPQDVPTDLCGSVRSIVAQGLLSFDHLDSHEVDYTVESAISRMSLDPNMLFENLSGGQRRRVLLARAIVSEPDLLLLDEPTNHLDIPSIQWLENFLVRLPSSLLFVSHDRAFVRRMATRILELDRGRISSWEGGYDRYLERKEARQEEEDRSNALFDKRLAEEEVWIRKGIKARRTRNEGRVRALWRMREERNNRRERQGQVQMEIGESDRSGKLVIQTQALQFSWPGKAIVQSLDLLITRGDRVGIVGPNGSGKTTLLNLLLGNLSPQSGTVRLGTNLQIAYFDQLRLELDNNQTLLENIGDGKEYIQINGKSRHVLSYLGDFLFSADRARGPISALSGGERNRLLLARLFSKPSNLLVLDEPTNDLDMETLDLLEDLLAEYSGTVIAVSHDREFLDRVVGSCLILEDEGQVHEFIGGYSDWETYRQERDKQREKALKNPEPAQNINSTGSTPTPLRRKLSYKEQRELELLPAKIEELEQKIGKTQAELADPATFTNHMRLQELQNSLEKLESDLLNAYARWEELGH